MTRRLPVYLLLDCSESMAGPAIEAVSAGVYALTNQLRGNPLALETVYLSVITFSREAKQILPLTELIVFNPPELTVRPGTALGGALCLLIDCLGREIVKTTEYTKGDYKPLVFILTDGHPTDNWIEYADRIKNRQHPKIANIYAIGCGPDVDTEVLYRITDIVLMMPDLSPETVRKLFIWLTASIQTASVKLTTKFGEEPVMDFPKDLLEIASKFTHKKDRIPANLFLHARCARTRFPYLMRYQLNREYGKYIPVASHQLQVLEEGDADLLPPINSSLITGCPPCPYCENAGVLLCSCGALFCDAGTATEGIICPGCNVQINNITEGGNFNIKNIQG